MSEIPPLGTPNTPTLGGTLLPEGWAPPMPSVAAPEGATAAEMEQVSKEFRQWAARYWRTHRHTGEPYTPSLRASLEAGMSEETKAWLAGIEAEHGVGSGAAASAEAAATGGAASAADDAARAATGTPAGVTTHGVPTAPAATTGSTASGTAPKPASAPASGAAPAGAPAGGTAAPAGGAAPSGTAPTGGTTTVAKTAEELAEEAAREAKRWKNLSKLGKTGRVLQYGGNAIGLYDIVFNNAMMEGGRQVDELNQFSEHRRLDAEVKREMLRRAQQNSFAQNHAGLNQLLQLGENAMWAAGASAAIPVVGEFAAPILGTIAGGSALLRHSLNKEDEQYIAQAKDVANDQNW